MQVHVDVDPPSTTAGPFARRRVPRHRCPTSAWCWSPTCRSPAPTTTRAAAARCWRWRAALAEGHRGRRAAAPGADADLDVGRRDPRQRMAGRRSRRGRKGVQAMMSLDMTGEDTAKTGGTFLIEKQADPSAVWARPSDPHTEWGASQVEADSLKGSLLNDLHLAVACAAPRRPAGSCGPIPTKAAAITPPSPTPACRAAQLALHRSLLPHESGRPDKTSAAEMANVGVTVATTAWFLASADEHDATSVCNCSRRRLSAASRSSASRVRGLVAAASDRAAAQSTETAVDRRVEKWYDEALDSVEAAAGQGPIASTRRQALRGRKRSSRRSDHRRAQRALAELGRRINDARRITGLPERASRPPAASRPSAAKTACGAPIELRIWRRRRRSARPSARLGMVRLAPAGHREVHAKSAHKVLARWSDDGRLHADHAERRRPARTARGTVCSASTALSGTALHRICGNAPWEDRRAPLPGVSPRCPKCAALARPGVVWFGEAIDYGVLTAPCRQRPATSSSRSARRLSYIPPPVSCTQAPAARLRRKSTRSRRIAAVDLTSRLPCRRRRRCRPWGSDVDPATAGTGLSDSRQRDFLLLQDTSPSCRRTRSRTPRRSGRTAPARCPRSRRSSRAAAWCSRSRASRSLPTRARTESR